MFFFFEKWKKKNQTYWAIWKSRIVSVVVYPLHYNKLTIWNKRNGRENGLEFEQIFPVFNRKSIILLFFPLINVVQWNIHAVYVAFCYFFLFLTQIRVNEMNGGKEKEEVNKIMFTFHQSHRQWDGLHREKRKETITTGNYISPPWGFLKRLFICLFFYFILFAVVTVCIVHWINHFLLTKSSVYEKNRVKKWRRKEIDAFFFLSFVHCGCFRKIALLLTIR